MTEMGISRERGVVTWMEKYAPFGLFTTDTRLIITEWNLWLENHSGRTRQEALGRNLLDLYPDLVTRKMDRYFHEALEGQNALLSHTFHRYLLPMQTDAGGDPAVNMPQSAIISPLILDGRICGTVGYIEDVSERISREKELIAQVDEEKRLVIKLNSSEEALRESEEKYKRVSDNSPAVLYQFMMAPGGEFSFPYVSDVIVDTLGVTPEEVMKDPSKLLGMVHPDDRKMFQESINSSAESLESFPLTFRFMKDGEEIWVEARGMPTPLADGGMLWDGFLLDITGRKRAEEALRESEGKYRGLVEGLDEAIYRMSLPDGKYEYMSPAARKIFGCSAEEFIENPLIIKKLIHPDFAEYFEEKWTDLMEGQVSPAYMYKILDPEENERWIVQSNIGIFDDSGNIIAIEGLIRNITERKKAEEQIKVSLKEKEILLREIHHRVKNNMQVITSLLRLQSDTIKDQQYADMFRESQERIRSMALIHEKLYQSKEFGNIDFDGYLRTLINDLFISYGASPDKISIKIKTNDLSLELDYAIPCGLITNELVSNSLKYAFPGDGKGEINIKLRSVAENEMELTVSDNGIGIPEEFDFRTTESLGLDLVKVLAEHQLGGRIEMNGTGGTRFSIRFMVKPGKTRI